MVKVRQRMWTSDWVSHATLPCLRHVGELPDRVDRDYHSTRRDVPRAGDLTSFGDPLRYVLTEVIGRRNPIAHRDRGSFLSRSFAEAAIDLDYASFLVPLSAGLMLVTEFSKCAIKLLSQIQI